MHQWIRIIPHRKLQPAPPGSYAATFDNNDAGDANYDIQAAITSGINNRREFDGVDIEDRPTHEFVVRYEPNIDSETVIEYNGERYRVVSTDDPEERGRFLYIRAQLLGGTNRQAAT